ncbi:hypothetical protein DV515_00017477, partial [Chloebia gouldiae]
MRRAAGACSCPTAPGSGQDRTRAPGQRPRGDKATMPRRARPRPGESYEERSERRQQERERLRCRDGASPGRPPRRPATSPRQSEFLRRRNLAEPGGTLPGHQPEAPSPPEPSSRVEPGASVPLQ